MKVMLMPRETPDLDKLPYPVYMSPKYDGIRCFIKDGVAYSRTFKPLPNINIQTWAKTHAKALEGMDGEIIVGKAWAEDVYRVTNSFVMSDDKQGEFFFFHFDFWNNDEPYDIRMGGYVVTTPSNYIKVPRALVMDKAHLLIYEAAEIS